jgi:hypothetical protein
LTAVRNYVLRRSSIGGVRRESWGFFFFSSGTGLVWYQSRLVLALSGTCLVWYRTCLVPIFSGTGLVWYSHYLVRHHRVRHRSSSSSSVAGTVIIKLVIIEFVIEFIIIFVIIEFVVIIIELVIIVIIIIEFDVSTVVSLMCIRFLHKRKGGPQSPFTARCNFVRGVLGCLGYRAATQPRSFHDPKSLPVMVWVHNCLEAWEAPTH